ncbi:MAG: methionine synthase [Chloroflexota bacterium]
MANKVKFSCLATGIGTLPDTDAGAACRRIFRHLKDVPFWPQLPKRSPKENMYLQFSEGFPGVVVEDDHIYAEKSDDFESKLEKVYVAYLENYPDDFAISQDYAAGLRAFVNCKDERYQFVKGQVTGPISWGLVATDRRQRGIIYDETLGDTVARFLRLKATWQEKLLRTMTENTIIFVDEPYLTSLGSAFVSIPPEKVVSLIGEVLCGIEGISGVHCCGSTDWSLMLGLPTDIVSFDAYNYSQSLSLYPDDVRAFLQRGGTIAWGIVPNDEETLAKETVASLGDRLGEAMAPFTRDGISYHTVQEQSLITPSCGLASLSSEAADHALNLLTKLSESLRQRL